MPEWQLKTTAEIAQVIGVSEIPQGAGLVSHQRLGSHGRTEIMKTRTKLRLLGGSILLFNLWLIGQYSIEGLPALLMTFGFAIAYEYVVVRRAPG